MMNIDYPFHFDSRARTAETTEDDHIRDLIEQVLFTAPGERANRPTFGSGLLQLIFAPINDALAGAVKISVQGALQQWLGDLIKADDVQVNTHESTVSVIVQYTVLRTQQRRVSEFQRGI